MSASAPAPTLPLPAPQRPVGLVLAAIALAVMACMGLLSGIIMVLTFALIHTPETAQFPVIKVIGIGIGVVTLLISGFCLWTVVGLFRVKRWARISVLILGGLLAFFSVLAALGSAIAALSQSTIPQSSPGLPPEAMKIVMFGAAGFYLCVGLIGVWWLVYFNLRRIKAVFVAHSVRPEVVTAAFVPIEGPRIDLNGPRRSVLGVLVNCLAALYIMGGVSGIACASFHLPLFFLGHIFRGTPATVFLAATSAISIGIAVGLIRRMRVAWIAALVFDALGVISELAILIPANRAAISSYQREILVRMFHGFPMPPNQLMMGETYIFVGAFGGALMFIVIFWLLIRARLLFQGR